MFNEPSYWGTDWIYFGTCTNETACINKLLITPHLPCYQYHRPSNLLTLQVVVVGVLSHPPVEESPGEVVDSILLVLNGLGHHLRIEMIVEEVIQMGLEGGGGQGEGEEGGNSGGTGDGSDKL